MKSEQPGVDSTMFALKEIARRWDEGKIQTQEAYDGMKRLIRNVEYFGRIQSQEVVALALKKESTMSRIKEFGIEAAYRVAAEQATLLARDAIAGALADGIDGDKESIRASIKKFLETEIGASLVSAMMYGLCRIIPIEDERVEHLSEEFIISALSRGGNSIVNIAMGPAREIIKTVLSGLPNNQLSLPIESEHKDKQVKIDNVESAQYEAVGVGKCEDVVGNR